VQAPGLPAGLRAACQWQKRPGSPVGPGAAPDPQFSSPHSCPRASHGPGCPVWGGRTHLETQWAAVSTHRWLIRPPPQMCCPWSRRLTCQGHCRGAAAIPPTIRASGLKLLPGGETGSPAGLLWGNRARWGAGELDPPPTSTADSIAHTQLSELQTALPSGTFYSDGHALYRGPVQSSAVQAPGHRKEVCPGTEELNFSS